MVQPEIIIYRGYPVELHTVLTEDGYLLGMLFYYFSFCNTCDHQGIDFRDPHSRAPHWEHTLFYGSVFPFLFRHRTMLQEKNKKK